MIDGISACYQRIADGVQASIQGEWHKAWVTAIFYSDHTFYSGQYDSGSSDQRTRSLALNKDVRRAFADLRELFKKDGKPVWCRATFELSAEGKFNMKWDYEDCDENGFAKFDEETELQRMRQLRNS